MRTFGETFRELRLEKKLSQEELVNDFNAKYGYSFVKSAISLYENNKRMPEISALCDFAEYFNVSLDYLLGKTYCRTLPALDPNEFKCLTPLDSNIELTKKDHKELRDLMNDTSDILMNSEGLMFDGEPVTEEDKQSILMAIEMSLSYIKQSNKDKYTPKKYKK